MRVYSSLEHVRRYPERFLRNVPPNGAELAEKLAGDLLMLNCNRAMLLHVGAWFCVASDTVWLPSRDSTQLRRSFEEMRPFPEAGENSIHSEILLGAFASNIVFIASGDGRVQLTGTSPAPDEALPLWAAQAVWFRVDAPPT